MAAGDLGATHYRWRPDVARIVRDIEANWPYVRCNTYVDHPFPGWDGRSIDVWERPGRGHALDRETGAALRDYLFYLQWGPLMRHYIWRHTLWTSFGGRSRWGPDDHVGWLRHLHVTYW